MMGNKGKMKNLKKEKKTPKNDIGYGTKVAALKDMKIHNMDFDVFNNMNNNLVVQVVKSGNRFNAWDKDGVKYTSSITTGARKRAYENGTALEQRVNKKGKNYWWAVPMSVFES